MVKQKQPRIFVQIASYRDPECQWTVKDLFEKAAHPEAVNVAICWQYSKTDDTNIFDVPSPRPHQTKSVMVDFRETQGVCWARAQAQSLYDGEDYVLMIDSHMRFIEGWDEAMIEELNRCPSEKPILSCYPPGYTPPDNLTENPLPSIVAAKPYDERGDIRFSSAILPAWPKEPRRGALIAAGFLFAPAQFIHDVPYDPYMYFNQEEISLSVRLYTFGWDVFMPSQVFLYHYYANAGDPNTAKPTHWGDNPDWHLYQNRARERCNLLLAGIVPEDYSATIELVKYGLGTVRTVEEFIAFTGIDVVKKTVSDAAQRANFGGIDDAPARDPNAFPIPLPALTQHDFLPPFCFVDDSGLTREMHLFAGKFAMLCYLPLSNPDFCEEFFTALEAKRADWDGAPFYWLFAIQGNVDTAKQFRQRFCPQYGVIADESGALARMLDNNRPLENSYSYVITPHQRLAGRFTNRNAINHVGDVVRVVGATKEVKWQPDVYGPGRAPILVFRNVLDAPLRERLLKHWEEGKQYQGTIGEGGQAKVVSSGKRRVDVNIEDKALLAELDAVMVKRLFPELNKIGSFDLRYRERFKIGCYKSEDQGYYNQHRDTGVPSLAYRRYSVSFALNEGYEGGWLEFPEYGPEARYKIPAGGALCFPSTLLHRVAPVTRGERFMMVSFMHGELEELAREKYLKDNGHTYHKSDVALLCDARYEGVTYSPHLWVA